MSRRSFGLIRKMRSGRFQASYLGPDGLRRNGPTTFTARRAAEEWLAEVQTEVRQGRWRAPELSNITFRHYALGWLADRDDLKPRTIDLYTRQLDLHILPYLGDYLLAALTPLTIRQWHSVLGQALRGASPNTADEVGPKRGATVRAQCYRLVHAVLAEAVRAGALESNPCNIRGGGSVKHAERTPATLAQVAIIAEAMPERYRFLVHAATWSGLRYGELAALRRGDVAIEGDWCGCLDKRCIGFHHGEGEPCSCPSEGKMTFNVARAVHRIGGRWVVTSPKSEAGTRVVHLPPHLALSLCDHLARFVPERDDALVFGTSTGNYVAGSNVSMMFRRARASAGRDDLHFHDLRHTGATLAAQAGATTRELMARLGHSTPRAAMIYQHAALDRDRVIARALSEAAGMLNVVPLHRVG
jgi:integrase